MPVSGLVVTLVEDGQARAHVIHRLAGDPRFTCGEPVGNRLPVALEAPDDRAARDIHQWLSELPGVEYLDVVFVGFDDDQGQHIPCQPKESRKECGEWI